MVGGGGGGGGGGVGSDATVADIVVLFVKPLLSVTVRLMVYVPLAAYVCVAVTPVALPPSPKVQA